ncbi:MAG: sodium:proton antiporter [Xanthobacteraceae bacterium]|nr:sodium:proton antiporter [Xanthobacteraceae bacterium]
MLAAFSKPANAAGLDGAMLTWPWALPFAGLLISIAAGPLLAPKLWHAHYGKVAFMWSALTIAPIAALYDLPTALATLAHALVGEYMSFIILLFALYVVAGGILVTGTLRGTPLVNTALLAFGTAIASIVGTTGAAMILVRPLLRANAGRLHNVHVVVFFIILVANIGGALSPLGDPPLFVGFLHGVDFFWTTVNLWAPTATAAGLVLVAFLAVDVFLHRKDRRIAVVGEPEPEAGLRVRGLVNLPLIALVVGAILLSATWKPGIAFDVYGTPLELQNLVRDGILLAIALVSLVATPDEHRERNGFSWEPILEVAKLFAGIFVCIVPVMVALQAGKSGPFAGLLAFMTTADDMPKNVAYFWLTGGLSALLDNAPTYLVFFELAGGDAGKLMSEQGTLAAISMGAVYMGALTYVGNAPNFMIYAIATERGVKMPSFFGYIAWSATILLPVFLVLTFAFVTSWPWPLFWH